MKTVRYRGAAALLLLASLSFAQPEADTSQRPLLDFRPAGLEASSAAIHTLISQGDPLSLMDWSLTVRPSLLYREYLEGRRDLQLNHRVSAILQVRFGERPLDTAQRAVRLERAIAAHETAIIRGVRDALLSHADLLLAQGAFQAASGGPDLAFRQAEHALQQAQAAAGSDSATYESLRFVFPALDVSTHPDYRLQRLRVGEAEARLLQAGPASILRDLRLGGAWRNRGLDVDLETGLLAGRPGVRLAAVTPGGRDRIEVRLSAEFVFESGDRTAQLHADLEAALAEVEAVAASLLQQAELALVDAGFAEEELGLAEDELAAARDVLTELQVQQAMVDPETDLSRAEREVARLQTRMYRAWITYVRRVADLLAATGGSWEWR